MAEHLAERQAAERRRQQAQASTEAMLERYHEYVEDKRNQLLEEMGIDLKDPTAELPATPRLSIHDSIRKCDFVLHLTLYYIQTAQIRVRCLPKVTWHTRG